jgi:hypothetical protein
MPASSQNRSSSPLPRARPSPWWLTLCTGKGPDRMAGPLRRDKPVLIPMYAEISQRPPPPRPFLNLLRSPVHLPLRYLVRALLGLSTVVVGAFSNTHHRDLSRPHKPHLLNHRPAAVTKGGDLQRLMASGLRRYGGTTACAWAGRAATFVGTWPGQAPPYCLVTSQNRLTPPSRRLAVASGVPGRIGRDWPWTAGHSRTAPYTTEIGRRPG